MKRKILALILLMITIAGYAQITQITHLGDPDNSVLSGDIAYAITGNSTNVFFTSEDKLYKVENNTAVKLNVVVKSASGYGKEKLKVMGDELYFFGGLINGGTGYELFKYNSSTNRASIVKDINPGNSSSFDTDSDYIGVTDNLIVFRVNNAGTNGKRLWKSDGTEAGTSLVKRIEPAEIHDDIRYLYGMNNIVYFLGFTRKEGRELWRTDGTETGTFMVKDINPEPHDTNYEKAVLQVIFFHIIKHFTLQQVQKIKDKNFGNQMVQKLEQFW